MEADLPGDVTDDAFLGGKLRLLQPVAGFRAGIDSVFLAASVPATEGDCILEAGTGPGAAALCLAWRVPSAEVLGIEIDAALVALAQENAKRNGLFERIKIMHGDVAAPPSELSGRVFDHVFANPPFLETGRVMAPRAPALDRARRGAPGSLELWVKFLLRHVAPKGTLTLIHRADGLGTLLGLLEGRAGGIEIFPLWPKDGMPARRVIVRARKASAAPLVLSPGIVLHDQNGRYKKEADAILRDGAALSFRA